LLQERFSANFLRLDVCSDAMIRLCVSAYLILFAKSLHNGKRK